MASFSIAPAEEDAETAEGAAAGADAETVAEADGSAAGSDGAE